jgi:hypothetical protein
MSSTYLNLKNGVANALGRTDGGTANALRDSLINQVIKGEIINQYPFSWTERADSSLTTDSSGQVDLPADYNHTFKLKDLRIVGASTQDDTTLSEVDYQVFDSFAAGEKRYYIDFNTSTSRYRLNTTEASTTLKAVYYFVPTDMSADADICVVPDQDCVVYLAAARYWLSSERDESNHDRFKQLGQARLGLMIQRDKKARPQRLRRGGFYTKNLGYNTNVFR